MLVTPAAHHAVLNSARSAASGAAAEHPHLHPHALQLGVRLASVVGPPQRLHVNRGAGRRRGGDPHGVPPAEVESYSRRTGARLVLAVAEPHTGDFLIKLRPDRTRSVEEVKDDLRERIHAAEPVIDVDMPGILGDLRRCWRATGS